MEDQDEDKNKTARQMLSDMSDAIDSLFRSYAAHRNDYSVLTKTAMSVDDDRMRASAHGSENTTNMASALKSAPLSPTAGPANAGASPMAHPMPALHLKM
jgi:hypothetical protein